VVPDLLRLLEDKYAHNYDEAAEALKKLAPKRRRKQACGESSRGLHVPSQP
jgi:hypothetical protein